MSNTEPRTLTPLSLAALGLLHEQPMHPYEISQTMRNRHMDYCIKLKFGSLYHTVETLLREGLIEPQETVREGRRPERTVYSITAAGREEFRARLSDMLAVPAREYADFAAGLKFIWHLERTTALALLEERQGAIEAELEHSRAVLQMLDQKGLRRLSYLELEHARAMQEAELAWLRGLAREISEKTLEWKAGHRTPAGMKETPR